MSIWHSLALNFCTCCSSFNVGMKQDEMTGNELKCALVTPISAASHKPIEWQHLQKGYYAPHAQFMQKLRLTAMPSKLSLLGLEGNILQKSVYQSKAFLRLPLSHHVTSPNDCCIHQALIVLHKACHLQ